MNPVWTGDLQIAQISPVIHIAVGFDAVLPVEAAHLLRRAKKE